MEIQILLHFPSEKAHGNSEFLVKFLGHLFQFFYAGKSSPRLIIYYISDYIAGYLEGLWKFRTSTKDSPLLRFYLIDFEFSSRGSRDGAAVRALASPQCSLDSIPSPGVKCGLSLLVVLVLAPRGFSPGTPIFPSPQKPTSPNSNSIFSLPD